MVYVPLTILPVPCANLPSSFANDYFQTFLFWLYFIRCLYSIASTISASIMEFSTSWSGEALPPKINWPSVTSRPENIFVNYFSVKFDRIFISSFEIISSLFYLTLFRVV